MSGLYVPGAFSKNKLPVEIQATVSIEPQPQQEPKSQPQKDSQPEPQQEKVTRTPKPSKPVISDIKPVEVKQCAWGGKKSFVECLKTVSNDVQPKEEPIVVKKNSTLTYVQKEIRKEEFDTFINKYDGKLRKLYEKSIYYEKEFFSRLRINGEQGYMSFCKFMFHVI